MTVEIFYKAVGLNQLQGVTRAACVAHMHSRACEKCGASILYGPNALDQTREVAMALGGHLVVVCPECADNVKADGVSEAYDPELTNRIAKSIKEMN